ncbi:MAG: hypothetical protein KDD66_03320 [Bdellovibrionales bacterium]|nr:hypothetical protein [Bdellovibrionales bacterium]
MDDLLPFISLVLLSAGLGIDNGLLIEFSIKTLNLSPKRHAVWRSVALVCAAILRIFFLLILSKLSFLEDPLPDSFWFPNRWFSEHPDDLTWMNLILFAGGLIIIFMALWEFYHKFREELAGHLLPSKNGTSTEIGKVLGVIAYLICMNILFSVDSVFAAVAMMSIETQFWWMISAILLAAFIMVFGMIPISAIIARNKHFGVLMLSVLIVIATKLLIDGTGAHFSNGLLMFIIAMLLINDAAQACIDWADKKGERLSATA